MKGRTDVRTVDDVMAIKPNFLASMGYQYFLSYGAPRAQLRYNHVTFPCSIAYFAREFTLFAKDFLQSSGSI